MRKGPFAAAVALASLFILTALAQPQAPQPANTFAVAGHAGSIAILKLNGRSYVDIEDLTRLTQGSLSFHGNQTLLTLTPVPQAAAAAEAPAEKQGFSKEFLRSAIEQMGLIREWRIGIVNAIQNNYPLSQDWVSAQRRKAETSLALASAAISTDDDRKAFPLLSAEFTNMQTMSANFLTARSQAQYINPSSVQNDPLDQQILACSRGLAAMAASNTFQEEPACR